MTAPHASPVRWFVSIILALSLLGTRELLGAQEIGGGSASVATGYDLSGLRATHSDLLSSGAWSSNAAGETSQARGRPVVNDLLGRVDLPLTCPQNLDGSKLEPGGLVGLLVWERHGFLVQHRVFQENKQARCGCTLDFFARQSC